MIYYGINTLFSLKLPPKALLHNDNLYTTCLVLIIILIIEAIEFLKS